MGAEADCMFCKIVAGELPGEIVDSDERTVAFMDINPATRGHALVVPRAHSADLMEVAAEDLAATNAAARRLAARMDETLEPAGFNILNCCRPAAWQTVFHFHLHLVPRHDADGMALTWPVKNPPREKLVEYAERIRARLG